MDAPAGLVRRALSALVATVCFGSATVAQAAAASFAPGEWSAPQIVPSCLADPWGTGAGPVSPAYRICADLLRVLETVDNATVSFVPAMQLNCSIPGDEWISYPIGSRAVRFTTTPAFGRAFTAVPQQLARFSSSATALGGRWWTLHRDVADPANATGFLPPFVVEQFLAIGFLPPYATNATAIAPGKIGYFGVVGPVTEVNAPGGAVQFYFPDRTAVTPGTAIALGAPAPQALSQRASHYHDTAPAAGAPPPQSRIRKHDPACAGYTQLADVL
jgi:hypothetical protein